MRFWWPCGHDITSSAFLHQKTPSNLHQPRTVILFLLSGFPLCCRYYHLVVAFLSIRRSTLIRRIPLWIDICHPFRPPQFGVESCISWSIRTNIHYSNYYLHTLFSLIMASNPDPSRQDENPYFDSNVTYPTPSLSASTSGPQMSARAPEQPSTPTRERPPVLSRPGPANNPNPATNRQQSSIGLRRLRPQKSRGDTIPQQQQQQQQQQNEQTQGIAQPESSRAAGNRRRSSSEPQRPTFIADSSETNNKLRHLPSVPEMSESKPDATRQETGGRRGSLLFRTKTKKQPQPPQTAEEAEYDSRIVDFLDVVDPEVSTLTSITNVQNSLFIPSLGRWVNRRPTYDISEIQRPMPGRYPDSLANIAEEAQRTQTEEEERPGADRAYSISSRLEDSHYAVLPHGKTLEGWRKEDVDSLNDHVRHMLHSRRSKFKRGLKGFGRYVSRPLGFFVTLYATLITLFGLAWVLFLIGWIYVGTKQLYVINIIDYTLVALFAIMGDGLAPFRMVDTYHMIYIAHYRKPCYMILPTIYTTDTDLVQTVSAGSSARSSCFPISATTTTCPRSPSSPTLKPQPPANNSPPWMTRPSSPSFRPSSRKLLSTIRPSMQGRTPSTSHTRRRPISPSPCAS